MLLRAVLGLDFPDNGQPASMGRSGRTRRNSTIRRAPLMAELAPASFLGLEIIAPAGEAKLREQIRDKSVPAPAKKRPTKWEGCAK